MVCRWDAVLEPVLALFLYFCATTFCGGQGLFFVRVTEFAQEMPNRLRVGSNASSIEQCGGRFGHGDVAVMTNNLSEEGAMGIKFTPPFRTALWRCARRPCAPLRA